MWKYVFASFLLVIGVIELVLAFNPRLRETVMQNSLVRSKRAEPYVLVMAGVSALVTAAGIFLYGLFW
jgi:hypothetical protein